MKHTRGEPVDKYEQVLSKYDWHSPHPPRGYQYGVGRGAKAFVTSGELASGLTLSTLGKPTRDENDFFSAMDRLEEKPQRQAKKGRAGHDEAGEAASMGTAAGAAPVQKLTMEDLAAFSGLGTNNNGKPSPSAGSTAATATMMMTAGAAAAVPSAAAPPHTHSLAGGFLTTRSARNEAVDNAEEYLFSDERGLTLHDLLRGRNSAAQHNLMNILDMGSPDEQGTWITHARALREMGLAKKAQQTLKEGCARTGKLGPMIWLERLAYVSEDDVAVRRRILEEATAACPGEEQLWLQLLSYQPPHDALDCLQRAVIACPRGEELWLRVVDSVPAVRDQKRIITQALQRTQDLPLLWSKLARLEPSFEVGKQIFNAAAQRYPSFALVLEAAKYAEWSTYRFAEGDGAGMKREEVKAEETRARRIVVVMHEAIEATVAAASTQYLDIADGNSRLRWMDAAQQACTYGNAGDAERKGQRYVWTAAYMFLHFLLPKGSHAKTLEVQPTWLEDLTSMTDSPYTNHGTLCALWATWLLLERKGLLPSSSASPENPPSARSYPVPGTSSPAALPNTSGQGQVPWQVIEVLRAAVETAPDVALSSVLDAVLQHPQQRSLAGTGKREENAMSEVKKEPIGSDGEEEEEDEELAHRQEQNRPPASLTAVKSGNGPTVSDAGFPDGKGRFRLSDEDCLPLPFTLLFAQTTFLTQDSDEGGGGGGGGGTSADRGARSSVLASSPHLTLVLAKAFYVRRQYRTALLILQLAQSHSSAAKASEQRDAAPQEEEEESEDELVAATAKCYAALGMDREADACLQDAITRRVALRESTAPLSSSLSSDLLWVKLAVHRRSGRGAPCDLEAFLAEATSPHRCPRSERLWLMRLEAVRGRIANSLTSSSSASPLDGGGDNEGGKARHPISPAQVRELRGLYEQAVSLAHCPTSAALWVFIALRIEAELLNSAATARARLLDASLACGVNSGGVVSRKGNASAGARHLRAGVGDAGGTSPLLAAVALGVARAKVELLHAGPSQALEVVRETLQQLPKTSEGSFTVPVGELLQLSIDLEVPAARGRAAAQVMRQWKSREPLALLAVAKVYHAAGQFAKALDQAVKAATEDATVVAGGSGGVGRQTVRSNGWGDCAALLWGLAHRAEYRGAVGSKLGVAQPEVGEAPPPLTEAQVRGWLLRVLTGDAEGGDGDGGGGGANATKDDRITSTHAASGVKREEAAESGAGELDPPAGSFESLHLNRGPLWISVAKARDPSNVTLLGYRDSVEEMLRRTADLIGI